MSKATDIILAALKSVGVADATLKVYANAYEVGMDTDQEARLKPLLPADWRLKREVTMPGMLCIFPELNWVLASVDPPSVFNLYFDREEAEADMARANGPDFKCLDRQYVPMLYTDYAERKATFYLSGVPEQITPERWEEMLEVLPPMKWEQRPGWNSFLMSEMYDGTYTRQYVRFRHGGQTTCWTKMVDATKRDTWMTPQSLTPPAGVHNHLVPEWKPLEQLIAVAGLAAESVGEFMWMCESPEGTHQYKHRQTRRYIHLTNGTISDALTLQQARQALEWARQV